TEAAVAQSSPADFEKTMVLRAPAGGAKAEQGKPEAAPAAKSFGDTVVNPEMMQTQGPGLREAARQAVAVGESAPVGAAPSVTVTSPTPVAPVIQPAAAAALASATTTTGATAPHASGPHLQGTIQILSGPSAGKELPLSKP